MIPAEGDGRWQLARRGSKPRVRWRHRHPHALKMRGVAMRQLQARVDGFSLAKYVGLTVCCRRTIPPVGPASSNSNERKPRCRLKFGQNRVPLVVVGIANVLVLHGRQLNGRFVRIGWSGVPKSSVLVGTPHLRESVACKQSMVLAQLLLPPASEREGRRRAAALDGGWLGTIRHDAKQSPAA